MKIKEGFILREVAGDTIAMPSCEMNLNAMITLNETGAFLWKLLETETTEEELAASIVKQYGVDDETAKTAVHNFVEKLKENEFLA